MGHTAVLFCLDEKVARVVSLVLSEVGFTVDPVLESFLAVKKLTAQHYDAIILDCDNIQNSSLLFRSARSSVFNQDSLVIALVEGQAGVADAYRIGANLALTKPINVEQARGTLRVARSLLRKNADGATANPMTSHETSPPLADEGFALEDRSFQHAHSFADAGADSRIGAPALAAEQQFAAASQEISPPAMGLLADADYPTSGPMPWTRIEPVAEIEPERELHANDQSAKRDLTCGTVQNARNLAVEGPFDSRSGPVIATFEEKPPSLYAAAAAPARAKEQPRAKSDLKSNEEVLAKSTPRAPFLDDVVGREALAGRPGQDFPDREGSSSGELFAGFAEKTDHKRDDNQKTLVVAIAVLGLFAAGYFGWTRYASTGPGSDNVGLVHTGGAQQEASSQPEQQSGLRSNVARKARTVPEPSSAGQGTRVRSLALAQTVVAPASKATEPQAGQATRSDSSGWIALSLGNHGSASQNLVRQGSGAQATGSAAAHTAIAPVASSYKPQAEDATATAPNPVDVSLAPNSNSLSGILSSGTSVSTPTLARIRLSQGVSGGLLIKRVQPTYPAHARAAHVQGTVEIKARIDKEGRVVDPSVLTGDPMLAAAALDAVRQWRYKPYHLDGQAVEIETQIAITFKGD
ncbi:MAG: TonB family protein [Terriglobales bacterium]|jgi:TonB family protein